ncbi:hypothetical protein [Piscinibacter terrae]|uniref:hypothetical protein n=1 Tax=Piscinibacter terrae TaxID=2496871 RepID=UPI001F169C93|nr:hypothetical protein [Albitalea terrae]
MIVASGLVWWAMSSTSSPAAAADDASAQLPSPAASGSTAPTAPVLAFAASSVVQPAPMRPTPAASESEPRTVQQVTPQRDPYGDQTPDISDYINKGEKPTMGEVIDRLHRAGVYTGLGAFSPPGTRPPLMGIAVPEGFVLPEGYVRHYQATDDGQRIEPILMFAPGFQLHDAANRPIAMPKDRVVPPELAPPGMPIRRIAIPAPIESGGPGR